MTNLGKRWRDEVVIEEALEEVRDIVRRGVLEWAVATGDCVIRHFYGGDIDLAREDRPARATALEGFLAHRKLPIGAAAIRQAVRLAVQYRDLPPHLSDRLGKSHHVELLPVRSAAAKVKLATVAVQRDLTARELREKVRVEQPPHPGGPPRAPESIKRVVGCMRLLTEKGAREMFSSAGFKKMPYDEQAMFVAGLEEVIGKAKEILELAKQHAKG